MEITDEKIFKLALVTSLVGMMGMLFFASYIEPKEIVVNEITRNTISARQWLLQELLIQLKCLQVAKAAF